MKLKKEKIDKSKILNSQYYSFYIISDFKFPFIYDNY